MNVVWNAVKQGKAIGEVGKNLVTVLKLPDDGMLLFRAGNFFERSLEIVLKEGIIIHDALYITLAEALNAEFLTADEKQYYAAENYVKARLVR